MLRANHVQQRECVSVCFALRVGSSYEVCACWRPNAEAAGSWELPRSEAYGLGCCAAHSTTGVQTCMQDAPELPFVASGWRPRAQRHGRLPRGLVAADLRPVKLEALRLGIYAVAQMTRAVTCKLQKLSMLAFEVRGIDLRHGVPPLPRRPRQDRERCCGLVAQWPRVRSDRTTELRGAQRSRISWASHATLPSRGLVTS